MITIICAGLLADLVIAMGFAIYLLLPLPVLSYDQGGLETDSGQVTEVKRIRPGVIQVALTQGMEIDPKLKVGNACMTMASMTSYVHFRHVQTLPEVGEKVEVYSINRLHLFTGRSFNWVQGWKHISGPIPLKGSVELVEGNPGLSLA